MTQSDAHIGEWRRAGNGVVRLESIDGGKLQCRWYIDLNGIEYCGWRFNEKIDFDHPDQWELASQIVDNPGDLAAIAALIDHLYENGSVAERAFLDECWMPLFRDSA